MPDVIFVEDAADPTPAPAPDRKLRLQSRLLARLFLALSVAAGIAISFAVGAMLLRFGSVAGLQEGSFTFFIPLPPFDESLAAGFVSASSLPVWESTLVAVLLAARLLPGLFILWHLRALFALYSRGCVFSQDNARQIRVIAFALLMYAAVPFVTHGALFLVHLATTPVRMQIRQVDALVLGLVLFTIARVMMLGHEIERDQQGFV